MNISVLPCGLLEANCYFLTDENSKNCILIDPGDFEDVKNILEERRNNPCYILLTHGHFDHCFGVSLLKEKYGAKICMHTDDVELVSDHQIFISYEQEELSCFKPDILLSDNDIITLDDIHLKVVHTPGHSKGSISLIDYADKCVFTGDTLFCESFGRTDFYGGSMKQIARSITQSLFSLPEDFIVFPGHGGKTTIGHEIRYNPMTKMKDHPWLYDYENSAEN